MAGTIKVLILPAEGRAAVKHVAHELSEPQALVGGYLEVGHRVGRDVWICNEDGRRMGLPVNKYEPGYVGDIFVCGTRGDRFTDISKTLEKSWREVYEMPSQPAHEQGTKGAGPLCESPGGGAPGRTE